MERFNLTLTCLIERLMAEEIGEEQQSTTDSYLPFELSCWLFSAKLGKLYARFSLTPKRPKIFKTSKLSVIISVNN